MSAEFLGVGRFLCPLQHVARAVCRRLIGVCTAAAAMAGATALGQVALPGYPDAGATQATPFQVIPDNDEYTGQVDAIHSPNVDQMLKPAYKLDVARRHSQLVITRRNVRRIAVTDSTIVNYVQYSPTELSIVGQELGTTDLTLWFEGEATPSIYEVTVIRDDNIEEQRRIDFGRLERKLAVMFPNSNVYLTPIGVQVHVRGQAYDAKEADQILQVVRAEVIQSYGRYGDLFNQTGYGNNFGGGAGGAGIGQNGLNQQINGGFGGLNDIIVNDLSIPGAYNVMLRVVIAEIDRSQQRDMNVDLSVAFQNGRHTVSSILGGATGQTIGGVFENGDITAAIRFLATNGTVNVLTEPRLVTMSGHPASLLGGGEFAVPTIIGLGGGQQTSFRGVGTSMVVTPTVIDRDLLRLQVQAEYSEIASGNSVNGIPGTNAKRVQTTVELREGQTLAIGGLMSRQTTTSVSRIPLLGDIPYLGTRLFHSKTSSEGDTELLVLVSPEIVNPMEPDEVPPLPNFYVTHPNDHDLCKYGRTEGNPDQNVYQLQPYGSGATYGIPQGYNLFNPPVNGPGYQTPAQTGAMMQNQPARNGLPTPSMQQYQSVTPSENQPPAVPPATNSLAPQPMNPNSPLPPVPGQQQSWNTPQTKKPGLTSRFASMFRRKKDPAAPAGSRFSTVGWQR